MRYVKHPEFLVRDKQYKMTEGGNVVYGVFDKLRVKQGEVWCRFLNQGPFWVRWKELSHVQVET